MFKSLAIFYSKIVLLNPQGLIAFKEFNLLIIAFEFMIVVVISVFAFTFLIVWKYRVGNHKIKKYNPDWDHDVRVELIWWAIPCVIVIILSVITWTSSHDLDPYKPISSNVPPITIEVVALDWKWLFIYPQQGIATVNFVEFPAQTPINFQITADAPMNSFWIPQLAGQIYAMPGMSTQLHLESFGLGNYNGLSANMSGEGFAGMKFVAHSVSRADFNQWVASVKQSPYTLNLAEYNELSEPSQNNPITFYSSIEQNLYTEIVMKFMMPKMQDESASSSLVSTATVIEQGTSTQIVNMSGMSGMSGNMTSN